MVVLNCSEKFNLVYFGTMSMCFFGMVQRFRIVQSWKIRYCTWVLLYITVFCRSSMIAAWNWILMNSITINILYIIYTLLNRGFLSLGLRLIHKYLHLSTNKCGLYKKQFMSPSKYPSHQAQELRKNDETNIVTGIRFWHPAPKSSHPPNFLWKSATQPVHIWGECARCCRSRPAVPQPIMAEKWTRIPNKQNMSIGLYQHLTG